MRGEKGGWCSSRHTDDKICKITEKRFKYLIYFLHFKRSYIQFHWEINVFLHLLSCFSVFLNTSCPPPYTLPPPSFTGLSRRRLFRTRIITSIKTQNVWAAVLKPPVCLFLLQHPSVRASSFPGPVVTTFPSRVENDLEQKWCMCMFQKPIVTVVFRGFFFTASEVIWTH